MKIGSMGERIYNEKILLSAAELERRKSLMMLGGLFSASSSDTITRSIEV